MGNPPLYQPVNFTSVAKKTVSEFINKRLLSKPFASYNTFSRFSQLNKINKKRKIQHNAKEYE
jgi:hypothetical protein